MEIFLDLPDSSFETPETWVFYGSELRGIATSEFQKSNSSAELRNEFRIFGAFGMPRHQLWNLKILELETTRYVISIPVVTEIKKR